MRKWTSLSLFFSTILLLVSSIAVYIKPTGSKARWHEWTLLGLDKGQWEALHTVQGFFFLFLIVIHIVLNVKPILAYLKQGTKVTGKRKPLIGALVVTLVVSAGAILEIPPINKVMVWGEYFSEEFGDASTAPPFSKAERSTLKEYCQKAQCSADAPWFKLHLPNPQWMDSTLKAIAKELDKSPAEVGGIIK